MGHWARAGKASTYYCDDRMMIWFESFLFNLHFAYTHTRIRVSRTALEGGRGRLFLTLLKDKEQKLKKSFNEWKNDLIESFEWTKNEEEMCVSLDERRCEQWKKVYYMSCKHIYMYNIYSVYYIHTVQEERENTRKLYKDMLMCYKIEHRTD